MSGEYGRLQAKINPISRSAIYFHCWAHQLNLVLVDLVSKIQSVNEFFDKLQSLYVFFTQSAVRHEKFVTIQREMLNIKESQVVQLQNLSETRWCRRHDAIKAVVKSYDCLLEATSSLSTKKPPASGYL
jgi:hypothetical protein